MILHCTPPSSLHIPNPALGYLKGFLQSREIHVKNVYWNLILAKSVSQFQRGLTKFSEDKDFFSIFPVLYISKKLLRGDPGKSTPLDLLYESLYSKEEIAEMIHTIKEEIDRYILQNNLHKTALAGVTVKSYQWLMSLYLIGRLKHLNPDITIVIGGITNEDQARAYMKVFSLADYAIWGEGEYPLVYLAQAVAEYTPVEDVPRLIYRDNTGICATKNVQEYSPLDLYPFADHSDYIETFEKFMISKTIPEYVRFSGSSVSDRYPVFIPIWGSRSCRWNRCRFCVLNEEYSYRARSPENIVREIEYQSGKYHIDSFIFVDTEIAGTLKRFKILLKLLMQSQAEKEKRYRLFAEISPIFINAETAKSMQRASFEEIQIGFEALTDSLLEKMDKRHRAAHNLQAVKLGTRHELQIRGLNVLKQIPTETEEDILESCANLHFLRFFLKEYPLTPGGLRLDRGSPFYEDVPEEERKKWRKNPIWKEVEPLSIIPEADRYEFFGFYRADHDEAWADFESLMNFYIKQDRSYEWIDYKDGSFVEERGLRLYKYIFDRDETDLLIFCDTIKSFSQVKRKFPRVSGDILCRMLENLKDAGFIYYDNGMRWIISVLDAARRKTLD